MSSRKSVKAFILRVPADVFKGLSLTARKEQTSINAHIEKLIVEDERRRADEAFAASFEQAGEQEDRDDVESLTRAASEVIRGDD